MTTCERGKRKRAIIKARRHVAYQRHAMTARIEVEPAKVALEILKAYRDAACSQKAAAEALGTREETLIRWIRRVDAKLGEDASFKGRTLRERLASVKVEAKKDGWHHDLNTRGGRPKAAVA